MPKVIQGWLFGKMAARGSRDASWGVRSWFGKFTTLINRGFRWITLTREFALRLILFTAVLVTFLPRISAGLCSALRWILSWTLKCGSELTLLPFYPRWTSRCLWCQGPTLCIFSYAIYGLLRSFVAHGLGWRRSIACQENSTLLKVWLFWSGRKFSSFFTCCPGRSSHW